MRAQVTYRVTLDPTATERNFLLDQMEVLHDLAIDGLEADCDDPGAVAYHAAQLGLGRAPGAGPSHSRPLGDPLGRQTPATSSSGRTTNRRP